MISGSFAERDLQLKASCAFLTPCSLLRRVMCDVCYPSICVCVCACLSVNVRACGILRGSDLFVGKTAVFEE